MAISNKKHFKIRYTPGDHEGFQFHMDIDAPLDDKTISTFMMIPGVERLKSEWRYHYCIMTNRMFSTFDMLNSFIAFMTQMGYINTGMSGKEIIEFEGNVNDDAMRRILSEEIGKSKDHFVIFNSEHKSTTMEKTIPQLEEEMYKCVNKEEYEKAAELRDEITKRKQDEKANITEGQQ